MLSRKIETRFAKVLPLLPGPVKSVVASRVAGMRTRELAKNPYPRWLTLFITNVCNARCEHCFYWYDLNSGVSELTMSDYERIFASMWWTFRTIRLSGGEPFSRKDLPDFYLLLDGTRRTEKLSIPTNGMLETMKPIARMLSSSRNRTSLNVSVSLDGLQATHDRFRRVKGGFGRAIKNLRAMVALSRDYPFFSVSVSTTITRANIDEVPELIAFLRHDVGIQDHGFDFIRSSSTDLFDIDHAVVLEEYTPPTEKLTSREAKAVAFLKAAEPSTSSDEFSIRERREIAQKIKMLLKPSQGNKLGFIRLEATTDVKQEQRRLIPCVAGSADCVIYPTGDVAVCELTKHVGNLKDYDLSFPALWNSDPMNTMRGKTRSCACTHPCHLSDSMAFHAETLRKMI